MSKRRKMLVIAFGSPFPLGSGQQYRFLNKLLAFRQLFDVAYLTLTPQSDADISRAEFGKLGIELIMPPSRYMRNALLRIIYRFAGFLYWLTTGLKFSNFLVRHIEFTAARIAGILKGRSFDIVVFEYWHAYHLIPFFHSCGALCALDMHDVQWRPYKNYLNAKPIPDWLKARLHRKYKLREERAWDEFDALIAINREEYNYVLERLPEKKIYHCPMGVDVANWPGKTKRLNGALRVGYYGSLGNKHNQQAVRLCMSEIMPVIWERLPEAEFWIIGNKPPEEFYQWQRKDARIHTTGFLENPADIIGGIHVMLCPWLSGRHGFRSRIVEVMSSATPVFCNGDAVSGMDITDGEGVIIEDDFRVLATRIVSLISDEKAYQRLSAAASGKVRKELTFESSYGRLSDDMYALVEGINLKTK